MGFSDRYAATRVTAEVSVPTVLPRPTAGNAHYRVVVELRNGKGAMEAPDDGRIYLRLVKADGTELANRLKDDSVGTNTLADSVDADFPHAGQFWLQQATALGVGRYEAFIQVQTGDTEQQLTLEVGWTENGTSSYAAARVRIGETSQETISELWDELLSGHTTTGSAGKALSDAAAGTGVSAILGTPVNGTVTADIAAVKAETASIQSDTNDIQSKIGTPAGVSVSADIAAIQTKLGTPAGASVSADIAAVKVDTVQILADIAALSIPTAAQNADAIWDEATAGHTTAGTFGKLSLDSLAELQNVTYGLSAAKTQRDAIEAAILSIQNNTGFASTVPQEMVLPPSGSVAVEMLANVYDSSGNMEDPDNSELLVRIRTPGGTYITNRLFKEAALTNALDSATDQTNFPTADGWRAMERESAGKMFMFYKNAAGQTEEAVVVEFGYAEATVLKYQPRSMSVTSTPSDTEAKVDTLQLNVGNFQAQTNLKSVLATLGNEWEDNNLPMDDFFMGPVGPWGVASPSLSSFTLTQKGLMPPFPMDDVYRQFVFFVVSGPNAGTAVTCTAYNGTTNVVTTAEAVTLSTSDVLVTSFGDTLLVHMTGYGFDMDLAAGPVPGSLAQMIKLITGDPTTDTHTTLTDKLGDVGDASSMNSVLGLIGDPTDALAQNDGTTDASLFAKLRAIGDMTSGSTNFKTLAQRIGDPADTAVDPDVGNGSLFAYLKNLEDQVANLAGATTGTRKAMFTEYIIIEPAELGADPTVSLEAGAVTTQSATYTALYQKAFTYPEGTAATTLDIFFLLHWAGQMTNGGGPGTGKTRWYVSTTSQTVNGSAALVSAQPLSVAFDETVTQSEHTISGRASNTIVPMTGTFYVILAGLVDDTQDTLAGSIYSDAHAEVTYKV